MTNEEIEKEKSKYTRKIEIPIYKPSADMPDISDLYDTSKKDELIKEINETPDLPEELKCFLYDAAERHVVFNFSKIADYYAHLPFKYKRLFEQSGLVIIDYDNAIRNGFMAYQEKLEKSRLEYVESVLTEELSKERNEKTQLKIKKLQEEKEYLENIEQDEEW